jgi:hypothetical protein
MVADWITVKLCPPDLLLIKYEQDNKYAVIEAYKSILRSQTSMALR